MKKILPGFMAIAACLLLQPGCKKKSKSSGEDTSGIPTTPTNTTTPTPTADPYTYSSDLQSSKDINTGLFTFTDIDMLCSFPTEAILYPKFYQSAPGNQNTVTVIYDNSIKYAAISFNNTGCADGKLRDGSVIVNFASANSTASYYHDPGFTGKISLSNFKLNGWQVKLLTNFVVTNLAPPAYDPATTNLSWNIKGDFVMIHPVDTTIKIQMSLNLVKTLANTSDPTVFSPSKTTAINWPKAVVLYSGKISGMATGYPFTLDISSAAPLKRDFNCTLPPPAPQEFHPIVSGVMTYSIGSFHPRTVDYGPNGNCDNSGTVSFKNESHTVIFD